jgi:hypothetical protein
MPSDERIPRALAAVRGLVDRFRAALTVTVEEVRSHLVAHRSTVDGRAARIAAELGPFGASRIDVERLAALADQQRPADPITIEAVAAALEALSGLAARGDDLFVVRVPEGGDLRDAVADALAEIGRAFGAARVARDARDGRRLPVAPGGGAGRLPFSRWTGGERRLAPPLVVEVHGGDLRAASLSEFLDGSQKLVLVIVGECAPAPLVRLVTPGTFVLQTDDGAGLDRLAAWDGPGAAAWVPASAARFVHDPAGGPASWQRIQITALPERVPRKTIGGLSAAQQAEELDLLRALGTRPAGAEAPASQAAAATGAAATPVDRLAAWLVSQTDLSDIR